MASSDVGDAAAANNSARGELESLVLSASLFGVRVRVRLVVVVKGTGPVRGASR
jgi:hypothetical protein